MGYTYSQYAREVFAQLSIVVLIVFALIYNDRRKTSVSRYTSYLLIVQAYFLSLIALKSDVDYSSMFGFTYKRLWGFAGVFWIAGIITLFVSHYVKNTKNIVFIKHAVLLSFVTLIMVNIVNFDYLIYHYAKARTGSGIDHSYLARLSPDSQSYGTHLRILMNDIQSNELYSDAGNMVLAEKLINKSVRLKEKYESEYDIRSFNLSEYRTYQEIKDMSLETYKTIIVKKQEQLNELQIPSVNQ
jgi:hypothetical protein